MDITQFNSKLNKLDGNIYTIEEVVNPIAGVYEKELAHDNVEVSTLNIYTGSKLTGSKINTYTTSTPSLTPWKTNIKIFSTEPVLYISYETTGDTVEAEDINNVQESINKTQEALNSEIDRAIDREKVIENNLTKEINRAKKAENDENLRAVNRENEIENNLNDEITRSKGAEKTLTDNLNTEINRAKKAETDETTRAKSAESILQTNIDNEATRAKSAESNITNNLNTEISRSKSEEGNIKTNLNSEITRAKSAENDIKNTINTNKPIWDDKYTKNEIDNKISKVITDLDWKESVETYSALSTTYPNPSDGWTVNVKDTDITYRWSGTAWISISANAIPLATNSVDGKMSKTDKSFLDTVKGLWNSVTTHISDAVKHITSAERTLWNTVSDKAEKDHNHDTLVYYDLTGKTIDLNDYTINDGIVEHRFYRCRTISGSANILNKPVADNPFVLEIECVRWGGTTDFITKQTFTSAETMCDYTRFYHSNVNTWTKWETNYNSKNLTKVSQLTNDAGYITQADVDTSQNHTHANKTVLDGITSDKVSSWDNKLSLSGGKVTGKTKFSQGTNVAYMATITVSGIYKHVAKITVRQNYQNQPITLDIIQRARFGTVIIEFKNSNTNDPELRRFTKIGELEAYLYKSATSTWELYIKMTEQYDCIDIMEFNKGEYMNLVDVTWTADTVTDLPTGYVKADRAYMDMTVERSVRDTDGNQINTTYVKKGTTWNELEGI